MLSKNIQSKNVCELYSSFYSTARTQLWNSNSCWLPLWWRYFWLSAKLHQRPVLAGWNWTSRRSASVRGETSLVVFPTNKTSLWARSLLVHRSGKVTCDKSDKSHYSYWGCLPNHEGLIVLLTDQNNKILVPEASTVSKGGWYNLAGYSSSSSVLVFCAKNKPHVVFANSELRLWYGEDWVDGTESDNGGKSCADVYGLLAY